MPFERKRRVLYRLLLGLVVWWVTSCNQTETRVSPNPTPTAPAWSWHGIVPGQTSREQAEKVLRSVLPSETSLQTGQGGFSWRVRLPAELAGHEQEEISYVLLDQGMVERVQVWEPNGTLADAISTYGPPPLVLGAMRGIEDPRRRVGLAYPQRGLVLMTGWGPSWDPETQDIEDAGTGILPQPDMPVLQTFYFGPQSVETFQASFPFSNLGRDPQGGGQGPWTRAWQGWGQ